MIILQPFTYVDERVERALQEALKLVPGARLVPVLTPVAQVTAYHNALVRMWTDPGFADEDLVIVEQDIKVPPGALREFDTCALPWCGFPNNAAGTLLVTTGCVKFSAKLRREAPDALRISRRIGVAQDGTEAGHWERIDVRVFGVLRGMGYQAHEHYPEVTHLRDEHVMSLRASTGRTD